MLDIAICEPATKKDLQEEQKQGELAIRLTFSSSLTRFSYTGRLQEPSNWRNPIRAGAILPGQKQVRSAQLANMRLSALNECKSVPAGRRRRFYPEPEKKPAKSVKLDQNMAARAEQERVSEPARERERERERAREIAGARPIDPEHPCWTPVWTATIVDHEAHPGCGAIRDIQDRHDPSRRPRRLRSRVTIIIAIVDAHLH